MRLSKLVWLALLSMALLLLGLWTLKPVLVVVSLVPLVYVLLLGMESQLAAPSLSVTRSASRTRVMAGDFVEMSVDVRNDGEDIPLLEIEDPVPEGATVVTGTNRELVSLRKGMSHALRYVVRLERRGRYRFGRLAARARDHTTMEFMEKTSDDTLEVSAIAEVEARRGIAIAPRRTRNWVGLIPSRRIGQGSEFFSIREYAPGDDIRRINWKASARHSKLLTNEYVSEQSGDVTVILDARGSGDVAVGKESLIDASVRAASTVSAHVLGAKNRVGLLIFRDCLDMVAPAFGKRQFYRISERLIDIKAAGDMPFENIVWLVERYFPVESLVVVISPLMDREMVGTIVWFCARGFDVVVISPSPVAMAKRTGLLSGIPLRIAALERSNAISELAKYARVVDWDTSISLGAALKQFAPRRGRR
ncbi:MAG: DUF58 domain-containing protein [Euryarchaeota archaeon]|nr:DUF58 domain-containing protein [Euryarchaeota archaeon]